MKWVCLVATMSSVLIVVSSNASASSLTLSFSGEFGPTTTIGGTALGANTPFSLTAVFDTTTGIPFRTGAELFPTIATFNVSGFGTYTSVSGDDLYVGLADPRSNNLNVYE